MSTLQLRELHKVYPGGVHAVRGVSADIAEGEFVSIIGPSGCGKTSVLRMIAGLESVSAGEVLIDGEFVNDETPQQRDIAMAFQEHALYPHLTAAQNMGFALKVAGVHRREVGRRVRSLAERLGLDDVLDRRPSQLSGGQRQRVAMARAIIRDPRLFLMDEPLSNLDATLRAEARATITSIHRRLECTTVYVTHDQLEAMSMSDRVLVMRHGLIVQRGTPVEVYRRPVDLFVGTFMGAPAMSAVLGRVEPGPTGTWILHLGSHTLAMPDGALDWVAADLVASGGDVVVGIRPESVLLDPQGELELSVDSSDLDSSEPVGPDQLVGFVVDGPAVRVGEEGEGIEVSDHPYSTVSMLARIDTPPGLWEPVRVRVDPFGLHLFAVDDGRAIAHGRVDATGRPTVSPATRSPQGPGDGSAASTRAG